MNTLKNLYIKINKDMLYIIIGFIAAIFCAAAILPLEVIEENLIPAWGIVTLFSAFMGFGDKFWWDDVKELF